MLGIIKENMPRRNAAAKKGKQKVSTPEMDEETEEGAEQEQEAQRMLPVCIEGFHKPFRTDRSFLEYSSNASRKGHSLHSGTPEKLFRTYT